MKLLTISLVVATVVLVAQCFPHGSLDIREEIDYEGGSGGDGTYYSPGLGACGITNKDTDFIVAVAEKFFSTYPGADPNNPNKNPLCGKNLTATYKAKTVNVTATDRCGGCTNPYSLDFSPSAFKALVGDDYETIGRVHNISWKFD